MAHVLGSILPEEEIQAPAQKCPLGLLVRKKVWDQSLPRYGFVVLIHKLAQAVRYPYRRVARGQRQVDNEGFKRGGRAQIPFLRISQGFHGKPSPACSL